MEATLRTRKLVHDDVASGLCAIVSRAFDALAREHPPCGMEDGVISFSQLERLIAIHLCHLQRTREGVERPRNSDAIPANK